MGIPGIGKTRGKRKFSAFTLVELIVVITILAVLATIGFLALSGYSQDAKDSAIRANVRSVQTAIASESAVTNRSPRYYVVHDSGAALSGALVYVDGNPTSLTGGDWNAAGTNYSAGNPDYAKLKLNAEKFKVSASGLPGGTLGVLARTAGFVPAEAAYDPRYLTVGAADAAAGTSGSGKKRTASYFQVAAISPATGAVTVSGNYPSSSGSVAGLVKDPKASSSTGALWDGGVSGISAPNGCSASWTTVNGHSYSVPALASGDSQAVQSSVAVTGGTQAYSQTFSCSNGVLSISGSETAGAVTCSADFGLNSNVCVPKSCRIQKEQVNNSSASANYSIDPDGTGGNPPFTAYCDMTTDGGGWTLVFYSNSSSVARSTVASGDWNAGPAVNFSRLYSMKNSKNASGLYEFFVKDSSTVGRYMTFTQTNAYDGNPVGNSFTKKTGNFYYSSQTAGSTWYGLALWNYGNSAFNASCTLAMASEGGSWTYCLQDQYAADYGTGPWFYDGGYDSWAQAWVQVYQK